MSFINTGINKNKTKYISQADVERINLKYRPDLMTIECCNKKIADGCEFTLWDGVIVQVCNDCLFQWFDELQIILGSSNTNEAKYYTINLGMTSFQVSKQSVLLLRTKLNKYLSNLYRLHIRDDLFYNTTFYQQKFVDKTRRVLNEPDKEYYMTKTMSQGERTMFYTVKRITDDLSQCSKFPFTISCDDEGKKRAVPTEPVLLSTFSNLPCRIGGHKHFKEAVAVLTDGREYGFTFSFCPEHLYQFAMALRQVYFNKSLTNVEVGDFVIKKGRYAQSCFLYKTHYSTMYKLHINEAIVVLCRAAIEKITELILLSAPFSELYPIEAQQFKKYITDLDAKERNELKESIKQEHDLRLEERTSLTSYYEGVLSDKVAEIRELEDLNHELKKENDDLNYKFKHLDKYLLDNEREYAESVKEDILNCKMSHTVINLGIQKKVARKKPVQTLQANFVYGMECRTFMHSPARKVVVIIDTGRVGDKFCLALCPSCVDIFIKGINEALNTGSYFDEIAGLIINTVNGNNKLHCHFCGDTEIKQFAVRMGCYKMNLCGNCLLQLRDGLEEIKKKFSLLRQLGGADFIFNGVLDFRF